jgi:predicted transcriptional regulator
MTRRSELEVKMDILRVTSEGANKPTQIMYKANLSWVALLGHLKQLTSSGFLTEVEYANRKVYEVSPRGLELLQSYQKIVKAVRDVPAEKPAF